MTTALEKIEIDWKSLFEQMSMGFAVHRMVWGKNGEAKDIVYLEVNPVYEKLTGLSRSKVLGKGVNEVIPGLENEWFERYGKVVKTGKPVTFEQESATLGKIFRVYAFKTGVDQFASVFADITEETKNELSLANEKILVNSLINSMSDFIFSKDVEGRYLVCNDSFANLFVGRPVEEVIGKTDEEIFGKEQEEKLNFILEKDKEVLEKGNDVKAEWEATLANGKKVKLETIKTRFRDEAGKLTGLVGVSRDVTERRKIEDELKQRAESLEQMNKLMVDRELKMIELKKEIEKLKNKSDQ